MLELNDKRVQVVIFISNKFTDYVYTAFYTTGSNLLQINSIKLEKWECLEGCGFVGLLENLYQLGFFFFLLNCLNNVVID